MNFTISQISEDRKSFASYRYEIKLDGEPFAIFSHNFRGECENLKLLKRKFSEDPPFGMCHHFVSGGGSQGHVLTEKATEYLIGLASI